MPTLETTIRELMPSIYEERAGLLGRPAWVDISHSNQCQPLTFDLMQALQNRGFQVRREYHEDTNGNWHYMLAHTHATSEPSASDIMTDVNPWQWTENPGLTGPLHASREDIMQTLQESGAPPFFIALRSIETIALAHAAQK